MYGKLFIQLTNILAIMATKMKSIPHYILRDEKEYVGIEDLYIGVDDLPPADFEDTEYFEIQY